MRGFKIDLAVQFDSFNFQFSIPPHLKLILVNQIACLDFFLVNKTIIQIKKDIVHKWRGRKSCIVHSFANIATIVVAVYTRIEEYARNLVNHNFHSDDAILKNRRTELNTTKQLTTPFHHKGVNGIITSCIGILILKN